MRIVKSAGSTDLPTMVPSDAPKLSASSYTLPCHLRYMEEFVVLYFPPRGIHAGKRPKLIEVLSSIRLFLVSWLGIV
jgi:hypothetical protein